MANIPYRSKLLPHWETIKRLRGERQTWAEIAQYLTDKCDCQTTFQAVHIFYKRKTKGHVPLGFDAAKVAPETPQQEAAPKPQRKARAAAETSQQAASKSPRQSDATAADASPAAPEANPESIFDKPEERQWKKPKFNTDF